MAVSSPSVWQADWRSRLYEAAQRLGYSTITQFAKERPEATWSQLAQELENHSSSRFAPVQVYSTQQSEITTPMEMSYYIKSSLVRRIREAIPDGWSGGDDFTFKVVSAFANWTASLPQEYTEQCRNSYRELISKQLEQGWLPHGPDDPVIVESLESAGFVQP